MAKVVDDEFHHMAASYVTLKYTTHADERQRSMGLSYVTAEKQDLISEFAAFGRRCFDLATSESAEEEP